MHLPMECYLLIWMESLLLLTEAEAVREAVREALKHTKGNVTQAAKILGIGRNTLYKKIKQYNII